MKIRNKVTGEIREVPDGTLPMPSAARPEYDASTAPSIGRNLKEGLNEIPGFLKGALNKTRETTAQPIMRFLANRGFGPAQREMEALDSFRASHEPAPGEKAGEFAADAALLMAPTPFGKAGGAGKILGAAAQGTAQHQAQNYAQTGDINPLEAGAEMALSTALPAVGSKLGPALKRMGVDATRRGLGVSKTAMKGVNPPDLEAALQARKIPLVGGAARIAKERGEALGAADNARGDILDALGIKVNLSGANSSARKAIANDVSAGSSGLTPADEALAARWLDDYADQGKRVGKGTASWVPGRTAVEIRKGADKNAKFIAGQTPEGRDLASRKYRGAIEDQLAARVDNSGNLDLARDYGNIKAEMGKDAPLLNAAQDRMAAQPGKVGLYTDLLLGGGAIGAGLVNPLAALGPASVILGRHAMTSPGGGRAFYEAGRALDNTNVKRGGRALLNLARSGVNAYGDSE